MAMLKSCGTAAFVLAATMGGLGVVHAQDADHPAADKLSIGLDVGERPFSFTGTDGKVDGFSYDLANAIAAKLERPGIEIVDVNFSAMFAALFAKRFEMVATSTTITQERSEQMLFTEPYISTGMAFTVLKGSTFEGLDGVKGKSVAVNNGSSSDKWATEKAEELRLTVQRYNKSADALQALLSKRADVQIGEVPVMRHFETLNPNIQVTHEIDFGRTFGLAFRKEDGAFRDKVEAALECLKQDGTLESIHVKWFGKKPAPGSPAGTIYPGYGAPGFSGYRESTDPTGCR